MFKPIVLEDHSPECDNHKMAGWGNMTSRMFCELNPKHALFQNNGDFILITYPCCSWEKPHELVKLALNIKENGVKERYNNVYNVISDDDLKKYRLHGIEFKHPFMQLHFSYSNVCNNFNVITHNPKITFHYAYFGEWNQKLEESYKDAKNNIPEYLLDDLDHLYNKNRTIANVSFSESVKTLKELIKKLK